MYDDVKVKSLYKAMQVLEAFTTQKPERGVTELSEELGLYKSNVHNILTTFERCGYIEQTSTGKYRLAYKILELAHVVNSAMGLHKAVLPTINALSTDVGETVYFAVPKDGQVIYLEAAYPSNAFAARAMMGDKAEMYCTAIGKAMLAFMQSDLAVRCLHQQSFVPFTPTTLMSVDALSAELDTIRMRGYSLDNMEHEFGIKCVAVPVFDRTGQLIGGLSISGPSLRFEEQAVAAFASKLTAAAQQISARV